MNPFPDSPGQVTVGLDLRGRLRRFEVTPRRLAKSGPADVDWTPFFARAGLDTARFHPVEPRYQRFLSPDRRWAWIGFPREYPDTEYRIEAGAAEGRPVLFNVAPSNTLENLSGEPRSFRPSRTMIISNVAIPLFFVIILIAAAVLARRNLRRGRADRRGALRLAWLFFGLSVVTYGFRSPVLFTWIGPGEILQQFTPGLFFALVAWGGYLAAEPLGRQVWPTIFTASSRLLCRPRIEWRDPAVGRATLVGLIAGALMFFAHPLSRWILSLIRSAPLPPRPYDWDILLGQTAALAWIGNQVLLGLAVAFFTLVALVIARAVTHRRWSAALIAALVPFLVFRDELTNLPAQLVVTAVLIGVLLRWGLLAAGVAVVIYLLGFYAQSPDWSAWFSQGAVMTLALAALLALYAVWAATGGRPRGSAPDLVGAPHP